jgi:hypothetical protein
MSEGEPTAYSSSPTALRASVLVWVHLDADDFPLAQRPYGGAARLHLDAAHPSLFPYASEEDDGIRGRGDGVSKVDGSLLERLIACLQKGSPCGVTGVNAAIGGVRVRPVEHGL